MLAATGFSTISSDDNGVADQGRSGPRCRSLDADKMANWA